ncbi:MAG: DUF1127 domain-containing protein, partial [Hyphomicrobiaceae bacterium]
MVPHITRGSVPTVRPSPSTLSLTSCVLRLCRLIEAALRISRERRDLASLDERMLKDIGLSRSLAEREVTRD